MFGRVRNRFAFTFAIMVLLLASCVVSPTTNPPGERPTSVAQPMARPVPTSSALPPEIYFSLAYDSPALLHGTPPFTAMLSATFYGDPSLARTCQTIRWRFGDGAEETQPCRVNGERPYRVAIQHTYVQSGTFHADATITLANGRSVKTEKTQTIVVAFPEPISPTEPIIFWGAWSATILAAVVALVWLRRKSRRARIIGYSAIALGLVSFVPPFSYAPNPAGIVWALFGNYTYDPRLPFANRFLIAGDPTTTLRPLLDGLIGQTGLDPLDPVQPLARYEFVKVRYPARYGVIEVGARMMYADGSQRTYEIPLYQTSGIFGFYQADWRYDGLGRLRTEHRELPGTPFANATSSVHLGTPQLLHLHPQAQMLDADNFANWGPAGIPVQRLVWSPQGDAFLATQTINYDQHVLWLVKLDGTLPLRLADNVRDYVWSPDGRFIIFTDFLQLRQMYVASRDASSPRLLTGDPNLAPPGLTDEGVWYVWQNALWLAPYKASPPTQLAALTDLKSSNQEWLTEELVVRPSPDGKRVAYSCETKLCLQDRDGSNWIQTTMSLREATWNPSGTHLASVDWDHGRANVVLSLLRRDGVIERQIVLVPNGTAAPPQWTPNGNRIFVQTFPLGGRRILTIDVANGEILDLSQPRWDAWFALAPNGKRLLLTNGRGGFWTSEITYDQVGGN